MKRFVYLLTALLLVGCTVQPAPGPAKSNAVASPSIQIPVQAPEVSSEPAIILHRFAELVTKGDVQGASNLLAPNLQGVYQYNDYAPLLNTPRMEILRLVEMTGDSLWHADVGARDQKVIEAHVFALDVRYKVLGITRSYFKDGGVYHHQATVTKYTADGPWLISELSGIGN